MFFSSRGSRDAGFSFPRVQNAFLGKSDPELSIFCKDFSWGLRIPLGSCKGIDKPLGWGLGLGVFLEFQAIKWPNLEKWRAEWDFYVRVRQTTPKTLRVLDNPAFLSCFSLGWIFRSALLSPERLFLAENSPSIIHPCMFGLFQAKTVNYKDFTAHLACFWSLLVQILPF